MARQKIVRVDPGEAANAKRPRRPGYVRLTLDVPVGLDIRLGAHAKHQGKRKGDFAVKLLDQGCAKFGLDEILKAAFPQIPGEDEPVGQG